MVLNGANMFLHFSNSYCSEPGYGMQLLLWFGLGQETNVLLPEPRACAAGSFWMCASTFCLIHLNWKLVSTTI